MPQLDPRASGSTRSSRPTPPAPPPRSPSAATRPSPRSPRSWPARSTASSRWRENIEDAEHNTTRFLIMSREPQARAARRADRDDLCVQRAQRAGGALQGAGRLRHQRRQHDQARKLHGRRPFHRDPVLRRCRGAPRRPAAAGWRSRSSRFFSTEVKILGVYPAHPLRIAASARRTRRGSDAADRPRRAAPHRPRVFAAAGSAEERGARSSPTIWSRPICKGHDSHGVGMIPNYLRNLDGGKVAPNQQRACRQRERVARSSMTASAATARSSRARRPMLGIARAKANGVAVVALAQRAPYRPGRHLWRDVRRGRAGLAPFRQHHRSAAGGRAVARQRRRASAPTRVCIAMPGPTPDRPIIADMATSRIAMGKVRVARNKGEQIDARHPARRRGQADDRPARHVQPAARRADDLWRAQGLRARLYLRDAGGRGDRQRHDAAGAAGRRERHQRHADDRHRPVPARRSRLAASTRSRR